MRYINRRFTYLLTYLLSVLELGLMYVTDRSQTKASLNAPSC